MFKRLCGHDSRSRIDVFQSFEPRSSEKGGRRCEKKVDEDKEAAAPERPIIPAHKKRGESKRLSRSAVMRRAALSGLSSDAFERQLRPMWKRRLIAKRRTQSLHPNTLKSSHI